ncbi:acyl-CoA thioesterase [Inmirania thermothiophila]|uniref:Acyl-CoA thioesterase YciA n=1 Tax=Inmirania thermothiophila TaxID=1750597 RepID=A0A3N1Y570_9GAMM|nr:acyl-CoA thioesterase [Inmirania thermothiophila]ROR32427.1 acyl-CoA thioesterase YciA [Inmirania thermothiophila]
MSAEGDAGFEPRGALTLRTIAMPADTNPNGDIFGGWLMAQMDLAGGSAAVKRARGRVVTVAVDAMSFHLPVYVGDEVSCYAEVVRVGNTSIRIHVETWVCRGVGTRHFKVTEGTFVYVAVDEQGRPRPVPPEAPEEA